MRSRLASLSHPVLKLDEFLLRSDQSLYASGTGLAPLLSRAHLRILNSADTLESLHQSLKSLNLTDPSRLRPSWDMYFTHLASLAAQRSNCMKRRVGCVLTQNNRIISTGYNGTPRGVRNCNEGGCPRCNDAGNTSGQGLDTCLCIHAEENALLEAGRSRCVRCEVVMIAEKFHDMVINNLAD